MQTGASWIWVSVAFPRLEMFSAIVFKYVLDLFLSSPSGTHII